MNRWGCKYVHIYKAANVHRQDFELWRAGKKKGSSVISVRMEKVLSSGKSPPETSLPKKP